MSVLAKSGTGPGSRARVAWLLRVNRRLGPDPALRQLRTFAAAFHGGSFRREVSASAVSRWETGQTAVPWEAVRRYEELLGLERNLLTATARTVSRYLAPGVVRTVEPAGPAGEPLEDLLEQAVAGCLMTGDAWDRLVDGLCERPDVNLLQAGTWSRLAERLVEEMVRADGLPWMLRFESLNRLLNHPRAVPYVVRACADLASGPARSSATEIICALDNCDHPAAADRVLAELSEPSSLPARRGAVMACFRKTSYRHFPPDRLADLVRSLHEWAPAASPLGDQDEPLRAHLAALRPEHARALLGPAWTGTRQPLGERPRVSGRPHTRGDGRSALLWHPAPWAVPLRAGTRGHWPSLLRRVAGHVDSNVPVSDSTSADEVGIPASLLAETLVPPLFDVRLYACFLLAATPYRAAFADALVAELGRPAARLTPEAAVPLLDALRVVGDARHRPAVEELAVRPGVPRPVTYAAVRSLGHVAADAAETGHLRTAVAQQRAVWRRASTETSAATLMSLVYALGMASRTDVLTDVLTEIRADASTLPGAREAAACWLAVPTHLRASAQL
ncbi:XRE family transcriptional regulator [Streptomyces sp. NPDC008150]|uniref:XRE family transcriptional regulator n=1 Tax=Streptomyces sp. NPDC008150 TaxID=3364816 RepID=UPI0036EFA335